MKKFIALFLVLATALSMHASTERNRFRFLTRLETCEAILREFQADPQRAIPAEVWQQAKGVVITSQAQVAFGLGMQEGYGVIMVKRRDGSWSVPVVLRAGEASLGLQLGGKRVETIYVLMNEEAPRLLFEGRVNWGTDLAAVAGPYAKELEKQNPHLLQVPVLVYRGHQGLFAGASVKSGYISRSDAVNRAYYEKDLDLPELLYGNFIGRKFDTAPIMDLMKELSP